MKWMMWGSTSKKAVVRTKYAAIKHMICNKVLQDACKNICFVFYTILS